MMQAGSRLAALLDHGLHESEARVYLALVSHATLTAGTLTSMARVPRSHLYKVLQDLHAKGLVEILVEGRVRTYRARPFCEFLESRAGHLREALRGLEGQMTTLGASLRPPPMEAAAQEDASEVSLVLGRKAVARELDQIVERVERTLTIACSDRGLPRIRAHLAPWLESAGTRELPHVELFVPPAAADDPWLEALAEWPQVHVRRLPMPSGMITVIRDQTEVLVIHPIPDTGEARVGRDFTVHWSSAAFAASQRALLEAASRPERPHARARHATVRGGVEPALQTRAFGPRASRA